MGLFLSDLRQWISQPRRVLKSQEGGRRGRDSTPRPPPALGFRSALPPQGRRVFLLSSALTPAMGLSAIALGGLEAVLLLRTRRIPQITSLRSQQLCHSPTCYTRELLSLGEARGSNGRNRLKAQRRRGLCARAEIVCAVGSGLTGCQSAKAGCRG